ncbi:MAG TPA: dihydrodipicolinate synthase family protein [Isosphaeraceae bacterium]|jgi:hypothetical protein|nr:dihydrodipicolinate synthase family protein [Isosphaeraceae bacterium]
MSQPIPAPVLDALRRGLVIPAMPLALTADLRLDERRQRALVRYYDAAGAGGLAVGVHTTQFEIRDPEHALFEPVLALAAQELDRADAARAVPMVRVAGLCGPTSQAVAEAAMARSLGYHAGLLSLAATGLADDAARLDHCRAVAEVLPLVGFYLQRAVGGPILSHRFWRGFAAIDRVVAIKIAPFDRYRTLDVVRAVAESGRDDIALYTGNDDHIVLDLVTPYRFVVNGRPVERRVVGGLLGQWAVWTRRAVVLLDACHALARSEAPIPMDLLRQSVALTDANAAIFDVSNDFRGCIAGLHLVLRRQGLLDDVRTLDPRAGLGPGQEAEIDRVCRDHADLNDDDFIAQHLDAWLRP